MKIPETTYTIINSEYILADLQEGAASPPGDQSFIARPLETTEMDNLYQGSGQLRGEQRWRYVNYGTPKRRKKYYVAQLCEKHLLESSTIFNESIIEDLRKSLFPKPLPLNLVNDAFTDWLAPYPKMQLYGLLFFTAGFRQRFAESGYYYPQAYIISDYIAFLQYIREPFVDEDEDDSWFIQFDKFQDARIQFWINQLGISKA
jgi:hypothetical protein